MQWQRILLYLMIFPLMISGAPVTRKKGFGTRDVRFGELDVFLHRVIWSRRKRPTVWQQEKARKDRLSQLEDCSRTALSEIEEEKKQRDILLGELVSRVLSDDGYAEQIKRLLAGSLMPMSDDGRVSPLELSSTQQSIKDGEERDGDMAAFDFAPSPHEPSAWELAEERFSNN